MMKRIKLSFLLVVVGFLPIGLLAWSQTGIERQVSSSVKSEAKDGDAVFTIVNRRWSLGSELEPDGTPRPLLLLEEFKSERRLRVDCGPGTVRVTAWRGTEARPTHKMWTFEHQGDMGQLQGSMHPFYKITCDGCGIARSFYFELEHGRHVFTATEDLLDIYILGSDSGRYIAYEDGWDAATPLPLGTIEYGSRDSIIQTVIVRIRSVALQSRPAKLELLYEGRSRGGSLVLDKSRKGAGRSVFSDFSLVVDFTRAYGQIIIPISNDRLDVNNASVPDGYRVEVAK